MSFEAFNLHPTLAAALKAHGYKSPTPIQTQAIPKVMEGRDVLDGGAFEILEAAVAVVVVFPLLEGLLVDVEPHEAAIGLVLHVDADLFLHHVLLVLQGALVEVERGHAVGFKPQRRIFDQRL